MNFIESFLKKNVKNIDLINLIFNLFYRKNLKIKKNIYLDFVWHDIVYYVTLIIIVLYT